MKHWLIMAVLLAAVATAPAPVFSQIADVVREKTIAASKEYIKSGNLLAGEGRYDAAAQSYRKAISLDPKSAEAYSLMGSALAQAGKLREAEEALRKAVSLKPDYAEGYFHLGNFLKSQNREAEAQEAFKKAKQYRR